MKLDFVRIGLCGLLNFHSVIEIIYFPRHT